MRIRGNAFQVHEKYLGLARDAASAGDRVAAENYYQHAEHYFRIYSVDQEERALRQPGNGQAADQQHQHNRHAGNGGGHPHGQSHGNRDGQADVNGSANGVNGEEPVAASLAPDSAIDLSGSDEEEGNNAAPSDTDEAKRQAPVRRPPRRRRPASSD